MKLQKIFLGADHAGFELKEYVKKYLTELGMQIEDIGAYKFEPQDDYPDFVIPVAKKVAENPSYNKGIIFGASGQGEAIVANKIRGVRAAVYYGGDIEIIRLSRTHNNTNILSLGARFLTKSRALEAINLWLNTDFSNEKRHIRRISKINNI